MQHTANRRERLRRTLESEGLDALLISGPPNVTYLTGFTGDSSALVLLADREILLSDPRYVGQIADECPELETAIRSPHRTVPQAMGDLVAKLGVRRVGCESNHLHLADAQTLREIAPTVEWKPEAGRVEKLRMVKDALELAQIREAIRVAQKAFVAFQATLRADDTEKDLADQMEALVRRCGGATCAFAPIIAVGTRAALPHCPPTQRRVREADLLLVDWGARLASGYHSDLTRVFDTHRTSSSHPASPDRLARIYAIVRRAQQAAMDAVRPGVKACEVDRAARAVIEEAGFGEQFGHGLGHGIGLQIHEPPFLRSTSEVVLAEGMVFTLEPGIYLPEWGGVRIEDDVRVTADGCEILTSVPRESALVF
jgi:Xaa-Pro aminopeptidase